MIELDGSQHIHLEDYGIQRTEFLKSQSYRVIRFWNNAVMNNINDVLREIHFVIDKK